MSNSDSIASTVIPAASAFGGSIIGAVTMIRYANPRSVMDFVHLLISGVVFGVFAGSFAIQALYFYFPVLMPDFEAIRNAILSGRSAGIVIFSGVEFFKWIAAGGVFVFCSIPGMWFFAAFARYLQKNSDEIISNALDNARRKILKDKE